METRKAFVVRRAGPEDAAQACKVLRRSIIECCTADHRGDTAVLSSWLANKTPENLRSWFSSTGHAVVAEQEGAIVGVAMLSGSGGIILNYLLPEMRHKGMGRTMLGALEDEAARRGVRVVELSSTATAHEFYLRNGYVDTGKKSVMFGLTSPIMTKALAAGLMAEQAALPAP